MTNKLSKDVPERSSLQRVVRRRRDLWNKCHECGRIIPYDDFESGKALNRMISPDSDVSSEEWEILCREHYKPSNAAHKPSGEQP